MKRLGMGKVAFQDPFAISLITADNRSHCERLILDLALRIL